MGRAGKKSRGVFPRGAQIAVYATGALWFIAWFGLARGAGYMVPILSMTVGIAVGAACRVSGGGGDAAIGPTGMTALIVTLACLYIGTVGFRAKQVEVTLASIGGPFEGEEGEEIEARIAELAAEKHKMPHWLTALGFVSVSVTMAYVITRNPPASHQTYERSARREGAGAGSGDAPKPTRSRRGRRRR